MTSQHHLGMTGLSDGNVDGNVPSPFDPAITAAPVCGEADGSVYRDFEQAVLGPVFLLNWNQLPQRTGVFPDARMIDLAEQTVALLITTVRPDGWVPVEPTAAGSLLQAGRIVLATEPDGVFRRRARVSLSSVRVRFRKPTM